MSIDLTAVRAPKAPETDRSEVPRRWGNGTNRAAPKITTITATSAKLASDTTKIDQW